MAASKRDPPLTPAIFGCFPACASDCGVDGADALGSFFSFRAGAALCPTLRSVIAPSALWSTHHKPRGALACSIRVTRQAIPSAIYCKISTLTALDLGRRLAQRKYHGNIHWSSEINRVGTIFCRLEVVEHSRKREICAPVEH